MLPQPMTKLKLTLRNTQVLRFQRWISHRLSGNMELLGWNATIRQRQRMWSSRNAPQIKEKRLKKRCGSLAWYLTPFNAEFISYPLATHIENPAEFFAPPGFLYIFRISLFYYTLIFFVHFHPIYPENIGYSPCASVGKIRIAASEAAAFVSALTRLF